MTDSATIIARLRRRESANLKGDHDLNPGMSPIREPVPAAVLVPLIVRDGTTTVMLTRRTDHLEHHPGQISFPGGHYEPGDDTPEATAIRETEEETGLHQRHLEIIGRLDIYQTGTGFRVTPVVALVTPPFELRADPDEVADIFEVPLDFLLDPANHQRHSQEIEGVKRQFHAIPYKDYYIWGATAGMLMNLYEIVKK